MRLVVMLSLAVVAAGPAVADEPMTPARAYIESLKRKGEHDYVHRFDRYRTSDVYECRSRANSVFGPIGVKETVMEDCLKARDLRRRGR